MRHLAEMVLGSLVEEGCANLLTSSGPGWLPKPIRLMVGLLDALPHRQPVG